MTDFALEAVYWFGSGLAFAVGVICGVALCRISVKYSSAQLQELRSDRAAWQADRDERRPYLVRVTEALEKIAGVKNE